MVITTMTSDTPTKASDDVQRVADPMPPACPA